MSIETEVKAVEQDVTKDVDAVATEIKADLDKVAPEVQAEIAKAEAAVTKIEKAARIDVSVREKLAVREMELEYVKVQMDLKTLTDRALAIQQNFTQTIATLAKKYEAEGSHVWNEVGGFFESLEAKLRKL